MLTWRLSNTMDVPFCVAALEEALQRFRKPQIFNGRIRHIEAVLLSRTSGPRTVPKRRHRVYPGLWSYDSEHY